MNRNRLFLIFALIGGILATPRSGISADFIVYSVNRGLDMGNAGETPQKDFYVNMGTANGVREGATLDVMRRLTTYDVLTEKFYREISFKIATIKVIHAEGNASVARLEKMAGTEKLPASAIKGIMIGDIVRPAEH